MNFVIKTGDTKYRLEQNRMSTLSKQPEKKKKKRRKKKKKKKEAPLLQDPCETHKE